MAANCTLISIPPSFNNGNPHFSSKYSYLAKNYLAQMPWYCLWLHDRVVAKAILRSEDWHSGKECMCVPFSLPLFPPSSWLSTRTAQTWTTHVDYIKSHLTNLLLSSYKREINAQLFKHLSTYLAYIILGCLCYSTLAYTLINII